MPLSEQRAAYYEDYAERLTHLLGEARVKGYSRKVIAKRAGISAPWLSELANGKGSASEVTNARLVTAFSSVGIDADSLVASLGTARTRSVSSYDGAFHLIDSNDELRAEMRLIVEGAEQVLSCTGSRSRERDYLNIILSRLRAMPDLIHHRALYGDPFHQVLKDHLLTLIDLRNRSAHNRERITVSIVRHQHLVSEQFVCANENRALVVLPSFSEVGNFDTAMLFVRPEHVVRLVKYGQDLTNCGTPLESKADVRKLRIRAADSVDSRGDR